MPLFISIRKLTAYVYISFSGEDRLRLCNSIRLLSGEVNGANLLGANRRCMDRQQIIAVIFTVLMVGSMVAWGATLI